MPATKNPNELALTAAAKDIRDGRLTSLELTNACLARIATRNGEIEAWTYLDENAARERARAADARTTSGETLGPLHGVPIGIKDIIDTKDMPTQNGCPIFTGNQPLDDAPCVDRLKEAGAIILGKTVTTELALLTPAKTKNPIDTTRTPGGSSAGSAAAVADNMVPAALGTQTAGSILRPASYCGVVGFKPSFGVIPRTGVLMQSHTLDTVGVLTRSVADAALMTQVLAGQYPTDSISTTLDDVDLFKRATTKPKREPRFAFFKSPAWSEADPSLHKSYEDFIASLGAHVALLSIDKFDDIIEWHRIVQIAENASYYGPLLDEHPQHISKGLTQRIVDGREEPVTVYIDAIRAREPAYKIVEAILEDHDAIITPAAPGPAPKGFSITGSPIFNGSWTYLGVPTISLPLLEAENVPLGVQLIAKRGGDAGLLQISAWLETFYNALK